MSRRLKMVVLGVAAFVALAIGAAVLWFSADQESYRAAANPCERACLQDSGGLVGCRQECASHPLTYGPDVPTPGH
jgi:hypothetical protein